MPISNLNKFIDKTAPSMPSSRSMSEAEAYDPSKFAIEYEFTRKDFSNNRSENYHKLNAMRQFIQRQTIAITSGLKSDPASLITLGKVKTTANGIPENKQEMEESSIPAKLRESEEKSSSKPKIRVVQKDCLYAAQALYKKTNRVPCVLDMANEFIPGGGYLHGSGAQEEDLLRRTTLVKHINPAAYQEKGFGDDTVLYSSNVEVFRSGADKGYDFLAEKDQFPINVIWSAALDLNKDENKKYLTEEYRQEYLARTKQRIRAQFEAARQNGQRDLVLSAFGCGAFRNDPNTVAKLYAEVLEEPAFQGQFDNVVFAIVPNPLQSHDNYRPFKQVLDPLKIQQKEFIRPTEGARVIIAANLMNQIGAAPEAELTKGNCLPYMEVNEQGQLVLLIEQDNAYKNQGIKFNTDETVELLEAYFLSQNYPFKTEELEKPELREVQNTSKSYGYKIILENPMDVLRLVSRDLNCSPEYFQIIYQNHPQFSPFEVLQDTIAAKITKIDKGTTFLDSISKLINGNQVNPLKPVLKDMQDKILKQFNGSNLGDIFKSIDETSLRKNQQVLLDALKIELLAIQTDYMPSTVAARM